LENNFIIATPLETSMKDPGNTQVYKQLPRGDIISHEHSKREKNIMEILNLITVALALLALVPKMESHIRPPLIPVSKAPRPLCASQFALVNYACSRLPFSPGVQPDSPPSPDEEEGHGERHQNHTHRHGHRHGHSHRHHQTPEENNCCRWAKEVDSQCVCEILVHLPPFLIRPVHQYTLNIGDACDVTYSCGAPI